MARDARAQRRNAERLGIAEPAGSSAARAASIAVAGAGAAGWPTSMWMTWPPAASMRAAAAITSITMNGGTSLRAEGAISRFAASSIDSTVCCRTGPAPLLPHSAASVAKPSGRLRGINLPGSAQWGQFHRRMRAALRRVIDGAQSAAGAAAQGSDYRLA